MSAVPETRRASIAHFDAIAARWEESPTRMAIARAVADVILTLLPPSGVGHAMEFGAGTGLVTALLAPAARQLTAVEQSPGMITAMRRKLDEHGIGNVQAVEGDVEQQLPAGPFDLVFSSMTLHHIADVPALFERVHEVLAPGGRIAMADLLSEDGSFHGPEVPGVMHHGFGVDELAGWLRTSGFIDIAVREVHRIRRVREDGTQREYPVLLATGRKSGTD